MASNLNYSQLDIELAKAEVRVRVLKTLQQRLYNLNTATNVSAHLQTLAMKIADQTVVVESLRTELNALVPS
jgi:hypothetical protein